MKCVICKKEIIKNNICSHCFPSDVDCKNNKHTSVVQWCLFFLLLAFVFNWFIEPQTKEIDFDISLGEEKYGNWYRDSNIYRNDTLNFSAFIFREKQGNVVLSFYSPSSNCTEYEDASTEHILNINMTPVRFLRHCAARGFERYTPATQEENGVAIAEFIKSKNVLIMNMWFAPDMIFSAIGFTKAYYFLMGK